jgi:hypothetical protein
MTLGHFLYIPGVLCLGLLIGYILGGRAAEVARADRDEQARRRAARQSARQSRTESEAGPEPGPEPKTDAPRMARDNPDAAADKPPAP